MRRRRGRYLKGREERIYIVRTDLDAVPPAVPVVEMHDIMAIVSITAATSRSNFMAERGFAENDRVFLVNLNYVLDNIREEDIIIRESTLREGTALEDFDNIKDNPLWIAIVEQTRKSTRLTCRDRQRG